MNSHTQRTIRRFATILLGAVAGVALLALLLGLSSTAGIMDAPQTALAADSPAVSSSMHMTSTQGMTKTMPMDGADGQHPMQAHMAQMMQMMTTDMQHMMATEDGDPAQMGRQMQMMGLMMQMRGLMMQMQAMDDVDDMEMEGMDMNDMSMGDMRMGMGGMAGDVTTGDLAPLVRGFYAGDELFFIHTEASDADVAQLLTEMMGPEVVVVPELAGTPDELLADVYVFQNGVAGMGPFGFQADVFDSVPGDAGYRPLRSVKLVTWADDAALRLLASVDAIREAEADGELTVTEPGVVANLPILSWPGGSR